MRRALQVLPWAVVALAFGCAHTNYRVYVYNGTSEKITEARITVSTGELLSFGSIGPEVDAGIWPVRGPLGQEVLVEWIDASNRKRSGKEPLPLSPLDDSVIFVINPNDHVTVQTGRGLHGYKRQR